MVIIFTCSVTKFPDFTWEFKYHYWPTRPKRWSLFSHMVSVRLSRKHNNAKKLKQKTRDNLSWGMMGHFEITRLVTDFTLEVEFHFQIWSKSFMWQTFSLKTTTTTVCARDACFKPFLQFFYSATIVKRFSTTTQHILE